MNEEQIKALWLRVTGFDADGDAADIIGFARALLADGGKGEAGEAYAKGYRAGKAFAHRHAPQAECAPREAQPIYQARTIGTTSWTDQSKDGYDHMSKYPACFETRIAAPTPERADDFCSNLSKTPERADADTALAPSITAEEFERWRIASKEHRDGLLANFPKEKPISDAMMDLVDRLGSEASEVDPRAWKHLLVYAPERANAEKDAALTDEQIVENWLTKMGLWDSAFVCQDQKATLAAFCSYARAILAANGEKP
jgi:hypothetical protein